MEVDGRTDLHFSPAAVWPVAAHAKVFITDPQRRAMTAIDLQTETQCGAFRSMVRETIGISEDGERIYSKTIDQSSIVCYATDVPQQLWASDVKLVTGMPPPCKVEKEGVMFGELRRLIFALEAHRQEV